MANSGDRRWGPVKEGEDLGQIDIRRVAGSITDYTALEEERSIRARLKYVPVICKYATETADGKEPMGIGIASCWNASRCLPNIV